MFGLIVERDSAIVFLQSSKAMQRPRSVSFVFVLLLLSSFSCFASAFQLQRPMVIVHTSRQLNNDTATPVRKTIQKKVVAERKKNKGDEQWINDNVLVKPIMEKMTKQCSSIFSQLIPILPGDGPRTTVTFLDPTEGAQQMATALELSDAAIPILAASFTEYQRLLENLFHEEQEEPSSSTAAAATKPWCHAKMTCTRGKEGTKCPRWHNDNVPIRWVQALIGPGCDYVASEEGVDRDAPIRMDGGVCRRVNEATADVRQGRTGEAIVLGGFQGFDKAAFHKSPTLRFMEGRVLLTIDVASLEQVQHQLEHPNGDGDTGCSSSDCQCPH